MQLSRPLLVALLLGPTPLLAQSVLLTAADFALLGGSAITSTAAVGTVISNGDVGLSPASTDFITGFPPAIINNGSITGNATAQAQLDRAAAALYLDGLATDANLTGTDLGGLTLNAGTYRFNTTAGLTGSLILDAQFQNNVAWVFQIGSALTTAASASITVINLGSNGGADLGVFWNADTDISIGADSFIIGNFISGASITLGASTDGSGRLLAGTAISLDQNELDAYGSPGGGDWTGGFASVPEPASTLWVAPLAALGFAASRRRLNRIR